MGAGERISSPRKVVEIGQSVVVTVLSIDTKAHRIALSMDAASRATQALYPTPCTRPRTMKPC